MSQTDLERYTEACNYPGQLNESAVERHLREYLLALGVDRTIVRLRQNWTLDEHPSLARSIDGIIKNFSNRLTPPHATRDARVARVARIARDARDARDAVDARDALTTSLTNLHRFASWCIQSGGWFYYSWELSWISTTYFGAKQLKKASVERWSKPLLEAFIAGAWFLYWTDDTLYWVTKPIVHLDQTSNIRRLHNDNYASVESDVENIYFWHGVMVPAFVVVRPDWITLKHIDGETNSEVRRVMIDRYKNGQEINGAAAYIRDVGGKRLDHDERFGTLWRQEVSNDEPIVMLEVVNSTREKNGSFKKYWLRVPPTMTKAHEAVAWTFDKSAKDYAPQIET